MMFVAKKSRKSKMLRPAIVISDSGPCDSEHSELNRNKGMSVSRHALMRDSLKRSARNAIVTSAMDMVDVSAATVSSMKNADDHIAVAGMWANTSGSVMNTSVAP